MNKDTILKYLSGQMEPEEKMNFQEKLKKDADLKAEYERLSAKLEQLSSNANIDLDSAYFNNLVPKVHIKLNSAKSKGFIRFAPAFSFGIVVLLIFLLQLPNMNENSFPGSEITEGDFASIILETDDSTLSDYLETGLVDNYSYYNYKTDDAFADIYLDDTILSEIGFDSATDYYEDNYTDDISDFSPEEANIIYEELINKKIL